MEVCGKDAQNTFELNMELWVPSEPNTGVILGSNSGQKCRPKKKFGFGPVQIFGPFRPY